MRRFVPILACLLLVLGLRPLGDAAAQGTPVLDGANAFITRWQGGAGTPIKVPLYGNYAYSCEKTDGTVIKAEVANVATQGLLELPVAEAGEYVLKAGPAGVKRIEFGTWGGDQYGGTRGTPWALLQVEQWGSVAWESFGGAFYGCENMSIAEGAGKPDLSGVTNMHSAFERCTKLNTPIGDWDVSKVMNMRRMFRGCSLFDQPLGSWTVSSLQRDANDARDLGLGFSNLSVSNYSSTLVDWSEKKDQLKAGICVDATGLYFDAAGKAARQVLIDEKQWVFDGDREPTVADPVLEIMNAPSQLYVGDTHTFKAQVLPAGVSQEVMWSVEEGDEWGTFSGSVLTVKKAGSISVRATAAVAPQPSRRVRVVVAVALTGISVSPATVQLKVNGTQQLTVGYTPADASNKMVTWSSSDEGVAMVDAQGVVTGRKAGMATITATAADGGHKATCEVTVSLDLTGITVSPATADLKVGGTQQLTVGYTPADATNKVVTWSSSDESIATVSVEGLVTGKKAGTATITATAADGGHKASCTVTVVAEDKPDAVESALLAGGVVSPNPFDGVLLVRGAEGVLRYSLVSATGVVMLDGAHAGVDELMLATSHLPTGIYWLRLVAADGERVVQVVRR